MLLEERLPEPPPELEPPELLLEFEPVAIIELDDVAVAKLEKIYGLYC